MLDQPLAIVDLETTGLSPKTDRILEIAILQVDGIDSPADNVRRWTTLVDPLRPVPAEITWLTGIDSDDVAQSPPFEQLIDTVLEQLRGRILIAHNARFDTAFLSQELRRAGRLERLPRALCSQRLSKALAPDAGSHGLDALIARHGLQVDDRHRAHGDAEATRQILRKFWFSHTPEQIEQACRAVMKRPALPPHLPPDCLDDVPESPGVYRMYGLNALPLYIGMSVNLRDRLAQHFSNSQTDERSQRLVQEVRRLEWETTAGKLGAGLREIELIHALMPAHNKAARLQTKGGFLTESATDNSRQLAGLHWMSISELTREHLQTGAAAVYGPIGSKASARRWLSELCRAVQGCDVMLGLQRGIPGVPCLSRQLNKCAGACAGEEPVDAMRQRVLDQLAPLALPVWPWAGPILVEERSDTEFEPDPDPDPESGQTAEGSLRARADWHLVDHWRWLGMAASREQALALLAASDGAWQFAAAQFKLVKKLVDQGVQLGRVHPLASSD